MVREQVKKRESAAYERALDIGNIASESQEDGYTSTNFEIQMHSLQWMPAA